MKANKHIYIWVVLIAAIFIYGACTPSWIDPITPGNQNNGNPGHRQESLDTRKVMLLYIAGYNNLQSYLTTNIEDLMKGWIPKNNRSNDVLLVFSHLSKSGSDFNTPTVPVLTRLYTDYSGKVIADTLVRYSTDAIAASATQLKEVLTYVKDNFEAKSYGLIFSSHATGFLPTGYYNRPGSYVYDESSMMYSSGKNRREHPTYTLYVEEELDPTRPMVKSIGQSYVNGRSYEIEIDDFAKAIPMKLDYVLFDACLMGGIEVAYELAGKCDYVAFSQAEVLAQGFNYKTITTHLLYNKEKSSPAMVCKDYIDYYNAMTGIYRSATVSLVDCSKLEPLADICHTLFSKYRAGIDGISPSKLQRFYTGSHPWFYDLQSIISVAGADENEVAELMDILDECILFKGHTPSFLSDFSIKTFSGFSMYLPKNGTTELNKYYRTLKWNQATGLVE